MALNYCRNDYSGGPSQGGMRRGVNGSAVCPTCGKRVRIMRDGRLWPHGTRTKNS